MISDEVRKKLLDSLKNKYQNNLQSMSCSEFFFDYVQLLYYKCHKINLNLDGSYIDSPDWIKNKRATINPVNKKDKKYSVTVALIYEKVGKQAKRITKIKLFIIKYTWEGINYPSEKDDWKNFEKNNVKFPLNFLHAKKKKIYHSYVSKHNSNREKQVILLMISNGEKQCKTKSEETMALSHSQKTISLVKRNNF